MRERPFVAGLVKDVFLPRMFRVRQKFPRDRIEEGDIPDRIASLLSQKKFAEKIHPGMRVAITAGSRGVANVALTTKCLADFVKSRGGKPFVVPAMGSHGGATAEGQREILAGYGVVEEGVGCPVVSSMEVKRIGLTEDGRDVLIDRNAAEADGIILGCRIKPHTEFRGPYESGIMKMMAIGLGKQAGAETCHAEGFKNMAKNVPLFGRAILKNANILFALPTIENAYDETCGIYAVDADEIETKEPELLRYAFTRMPKILVDECDVLVVDRIGKDFSGDGMDPNITGTFSTPYASGGLRSQHVAVLDLSAETHGNANGIGMASATTSRVFRQLDLASMYTNAITCMVLRGVDIPVVMESDRECIQVCVKMCIETDKSNPRIVRIPNSLHLEHIMLSESYWEEAEQNPLLEIEGEPENLPFDRDGNLW